MRVLVATDAWHPQVNGVVRTLMSLARSARSLGVEIEFLSPEGFWSVPGRHRGDGGRGPRHGRRQALATERPRVEPING
jgi:hypothetical protein